MQGRILGRFEIDETVAKGGMGQLYLAHEIGKPSASVVIKCVRPDPGAESDRERVRMFLDEARVATLLDHPNIVKVFEVDYQDGLYYMVMERLVGWDLYDVAKCLADIGQWMPVGILVRLMIDACRGLDAAHHCKTERGEVLDLVHRDVSLSNLFLTEDGNLKVLDFGVAQSAIQVAQTRSGEVKGKINYMSPEQLRSKLVDHRSDLFSLGVVIHELLTGNRLFKRATLVDSMRAVLTGFIPPPVRRNEPLNAELVSITMRALQREPELRFSSASELAAALEATQIATRGREPIVAMLRQLNPGSCGLAQDRGPTLTCSVDGLESWADSVVAEIDSRVHDIQSKRRDSILDQVLDPAFGIAADIDTAVETRVDTAVDAPVPPALETQVAVPPRRRLAAARLNAWLRSTRRSLGTRPGRWVAAALALFGVAALVGFLARGGMIDDTVTASPEPSVSPEVTATPPTSGAESVQPAALGSASERVLSVPVVDDGAGESPRPRARVRGTNKPARPTIKRDKPKARRGRLTLEARPWAEVYLGDKLLGTTPLINKSLSVGEVVLRLRNPETGLERTITVDITAGETLRKTIDLR